MHKSNDLDAFRPSEEIHLIDLPLLAVLYVLTLNMHFALLRATKDDQIKVNC